VNEYVAKCNSGLRDTITARRDGESVELKARSGGQYKMEAFLTPLKTREFARGLLKLADEIDGGEVAESADVTSDEPVKVGDRIRILVDSADGASVKRGDEFTVTNVDSYGGRTEVAVERAGSFGTPRHWYFGPTSWEKVEAPTVAAVDETPIASPRAAFLDEAHRLVGSGDVGDLLDVAKFLAGDNA
jgi:hypothetical protein